MNKKKVKDVLIKMMISGIVMFLVYYIYIVVDTHSIMQDIKQVAAGNEIDNKVYEKFTPKRTTIKNITKRYFTWCWGNKGEIWITYELTTFFSEGEKIVSRDYCSVIIEKREGQWEAIKVKYKP